MSVLLETVRAQSRHLDSDEKLLLGMELIDAAVLGESTEASARSASEAWDAEISRRIEEVRSGKVKTIPWEEVLARTNARFGWDK